MHQGYPKFVQNLWYATADNGLAALVYSASTVRAKVADGKEVVFAEETNYPFLDQIKFIYQTKSKVQFPLHLRIPEWCKKPIIKVNGKEQAYNGAKIVIINRQWSENDEVVLQLPMEFKFSYWYEKSVGVERGPLVYALKNGEKWSEVKTDTYKDTFYEVTHTTPWNYGISQKYINADSMMVKVNETINDYPWNLENAPITVTAKGRMIPFWEKTMNSTGKIPFPSYPYNNLGTPLETLTLIPYGCTTLRIAQFPVVDSHKR